MLSIKNQRMYSLCLNEANKSDLLYQHGCIATCGGKILARGYNTDRSRYNQNKYDIKTCTCHAEMSVLMKLDQSLSKKKHKANKIFKKITLYISRVKYEGISYNSAPCLECLTMIKYYKVKRIIFYLEKEYYILNPRDYITQHQSYGKIFVDKF